MSTYRVLAHYTMFGLPNCHTVEVRSITPEHARLIVLHSITKLFQGVTAVAAEVVP